MKNLKTRDSNMELLRIIAITFIVLYHLTAFFANAWGEENRLMYSLNLMLHTGVILFVLISGYYGIRFSFRGLFKLVAMMFVYYVPLMLVKNHYGIGNQTGGTLDTVCFITRTPYWYMRTYLVLFLMSPIINKCIASVSNRQRFFLLAILGVLAVYAGMIGKDPSLADGKNIVNFFFIYLIGNTIRLFQTDIKKAVRIRFFYIWLVYNILVVGACWLLKGSHAGSAVYILSFKYCSPGLILNSVLLFIAFTDLKFKSSFVNHAASSALAVYLIQEHPLVRHYLKSCISSFVQDTQDQTSAIMFWIGLSLGIVAVCMAADKILSPLWKLAQRAGERVDRYFRLEF